ncbi:hypothetical protein [Psychrobacter aestuarii]|uniref:Uncharacterized protein n=1 Tax=Psychrobacter aestuarii TaxID=556327 RepID=A0ABP3FI80_9GAMM|nr:hypothetical protein [Psychrobacter aestuarii]
MIPFIAEKQIHQVLIGKINLRSFEQWLYEDKVLESSNPDLYLELISFDYSSEYEFYDSFAKYVHFYKFEAERITEYLNSIIDRDENCSHATREMYELYCHGYEFLQKLGLIYGLCLVDCSHPVSLVDGCASIIDKFYPDIVDDAKNVIRWLEDGKIVFKGQDNGYGIFEYDDFRSESEIVQGKA